MKKMFFLIAVTVILAFSICGCKQQPQTPSTQPTQTETQVQPQPDTQPQAQPISLLDVFCEDFAFDDIHTGVNIYWYDGTKHYYFDSRNAEFCASLLEYLNTTMVVPMEKNAWDNDGQALYIHITNAEYGSLPFTINEKGQLQHNRPTFTYYQGEGIYEAFIRCISPYIENNAKFVQAVDGENYTKDYTIWNAKGEVMYAGNSFREEYLSVIDDRIVHRWGQAGTGVLTRWAVFYDVKDGRISPSYYGSTDSCGELVVNVGAKVVCVSDMFSGEELYRIDTFEYPLIDAIEAILAAYFINDGKQITVYYVDAEHGRHWQTFDLPEELWPDT